MLSILSESLSHIFFNFDDEQKNMIDYCTSDYIDRVKKIKPLFKAPETLVSGEMTSKIHQEFLSLVRKKMWSLLQGKYESSEQQEVLWILNLIYYYLLKQNPTCFIIEEPEAHLYPNSQKEITEYITLALAEKNECLITTHSPYILGTLSNLLDA